MKKKLLSIILSTACIISAMCFNNGDYMLIPEAASVAGDANNDGKLDIVDAAFIAKRVAQRRTDLLPEVADYNNDGKKNILDAASIAKTIAKRKPATTTPKVTTKVTTKTTKATTKSTVSVIPSTVYITKTGKHYHYSNTCNGGTYYSCSLKDAIAKKLTPCSKCVH